jgi:hypothetical protein
VKAFHDQSIFHQAPPQIILGNPLFLRRGVPAIPFVELFSQKRATATYWQNISLSTCIPFSTNIPKKAISKSI